MNKKIYLLTLLALLVLGSGSMTASTSAVDGLRVGLIYANAKTYPVIDYNARRKTAKDLVVVKSKASEFGAMAFFACNDSVTGEELWATNGLIAGTTIVKDINPGVAGSDVSWLTRFKDYVVFSANDGINGAELWISDGTADGTKMIKDINPGSESSNPTGFTQVNENQFIFCATSAGGTYQQLWVSDGTAEGTKMIKDCQVMFPGTNYETDGNTAPFMRVGRKVFFKADNASGLFGEELWVTDGTAEGTHMVKDINTTASETEQGVTEGSGVDYLYNYYNKLLVFKSAGQAWVSDGTEAGTCQIDTTGFWNNAGGPCNGYIYYRAGVTGGYKDVGLIRTNTKTGATEKIAVTKGYPLAGAAFENKYVFGTQNVNNIGYLYYIDDASNVPVKLTAVDSKNVLAREYVRARGSLYFQNFDNGVGVIWRVDTLTSKTKPAPADPFVGFVNTLRNFNGLIMFCNSPDQNQHQNLFWIDFKRVGYNATDSLNDVADMTPSYDAVVTGVPEIKTLPNMAKLTVYPNPTTDSFNFAVSGTAKDLKIYDLSGRLVKVVANPTDNIDVSAIAAGIYKVVVTTTTGKYVSSLIIK
jgi:ELWxxDGT repeat protein